MTPELVLSMAREAITTILIVSAPVLGIGLAVGLLVSIFQATTQIQEPTLAFVPKIAAVFIALLIFGGWIMRLITTFTLDLWENLGKLF
ncbi:MAG TPA: flagellar biosynthetic protein FliQ [Firmicutes bacterium]|nr:flagellar biosynthesis protein FliQ [Bacillota bacterium]HAA35149.1 flagellar biosynthetic protein FliQ [Bacillota bacterium]